MNILLINYEFPPLGAGAATATRYIGRELSAMGHKVLVVTSGFKKNKGYDVKEGMTIFRCPVIRKKIPESNIFEMASFVVSAFVCLPGLIKKHRIEGAIVFFCLPCGPLGLWINFLFNTPYIIALRGGDVPGNEKSMDRIHWALKPLRRWVLKKSQAVIANSNGLKALAQKADPIPMQVIPNGVDTCFFAPLEKKQLNPCVKLLFVGRLSQQKNLFFLLEQIADLVNRQHLEFNLHIAGDGPLRKQLQDHAQNLKISELIQWHGWIGKNELRRLYQRADCLVNPSFCEGMPNAVLEAMACGLPVIASNVAGNNEAVSHGRSGFLFNISSKSTLADLLESLIRNPELRLEMGVNARKIVLDTLSWNRSASHYLKYFFNELTGFSNAPGLPY